MKEGKDVFGFGYKADKKERERERETLLEQNYSASARGRDKFIYIWVPFPRGSFCHVGSSCLLLIISPFHFHFPAQLMHIFLLFIY